MDQRTPTPFEIRANGTGGQVIIGGQDISDQLTGLRLEMAGQQLAHLTLYASPIAGTIEGIALVEQIPGEPLEGTEEQELDRSALLSSAAALVRAIDPSALAAALAARPTRITESPAVVALEVIGDLLETAAALEAGPT